MAQGATSIAQPGTRIVNIVSFDAVHVSLTSRPASLPWRTVPVAFLRRWSARRRRRYIAEELLGEFRRCRSDLAELGENLPQEPNAQRHRVAVSFNRIDQQVKESCRLLVG